jgi:hypothetical protein
MAGDRLLCFGKLLTLKTLVAPGGRAAAPQQSALA